jgi:hypothetical protein
MTLAKDRSEKTSNANQINAGIGVVHHLALAAKKRRDESKDHLNLVIGRISYAK